MWAHPERHYDALGNSCKDALTMMKSACASKNHGVMHIVEINSRALKCAQE